MSDPVVTSTPEPIRYRDRAGLEGRLFAAAHDETAAPPSLSARAAALRRLRRTLATESNPWRASAPAFAAALALGLCVLVPLWRVRRLETRPVPVGSSDLRGPIPAPVAVAVQASARGESIDLGSSGTLRLAPGTTARLPNGAKSERVELQAGELCAEIAHRDLTRQTPFVVDAPGLKVFVIGTRFCVSTGFAGTSVEVSEGRVRVERAGEVAYVSAGERFPPPPSGPSTVGAIDGSQRSVPASPVLAAERPSAPAPLATVPSAASRAVETSTQCLRLASRAARADCYARLSGGEGLTAQNALYSLAVLTRDEEGDPRAAAGLFRAYLARFPAGALAPEVREQLAAIAGAQKE